MFPFLLAGVNLVIEWKYETQQMFIVFYQSQSWPKNNYMCHPLKSWTFGERESSLSISFFSIFHLTSIRYKAISGNKDIKEWREFGPTLDDIPNETHIYIGKEWALQNWDYVFLQERVVILLLLCRQERWGNFFNQIGNALLNGILKEL